MIGSTSPLAAIGLGFVLGLRHALDVDHLAAVSTIVSQRRSLWRSALVGALWGFGHTVSLVAVAVGVIGLHAEIPKSVGHALELGVAAMLIVLGVNLLRDVVAGRTHVHLHTHGTRAHAHPHAHAGDRRQHDHGRRRPFLVGLMHGLAGSAGLMLAVAATIPSPVVALAYVAVFGVGSIGGMVVMSMLFGIPALLTGDRFAGADTVLRVGAAAASVAIGLQLAWQIGSAAGLFA